MVRVNVSEQIVRTLEEKGVQYVFGLPGEENINLVNDLNKSDKIKFIRVYHEQSGAFMAEVMGWLTNKPGVVISTLGPGALNMVIGVADATSNSIPLLAISAQGGLQQFGKESSQMVDLKRIFTPITKWAENLYVAESTIEMINKAYHMAESNRPGATFLTIPDTLEQISTKKDTPPTIPNPKSEIISSTQQIRIAAKQIKQAKTPIILAGAGISREKAIEEFRQFVEQIEIPVATTFMSKGVVRDDSKYSLGVVGFFVDDYVNHEFYKADLIISIGYEFSEFEPKKINPRGDKDIIHIHSFKQDTDRNYPIQANVIGGLKHTLTLLADQLKEYKAPDFENNVRLQLKDEYEQGAIHSDVPLTPAQIVHATRSVLNEGDMVLVDTGGLKMWMGRLYPTYEPNSLLINNGLSSMAWTIPGAISAKFVYPQRPILIVIGDGSFHMASQEIAVAVEHNIPLTILIWDDSGYGLIRWKMDMDLGEHSGVDFENPDFIKIAEAYGGEGHIIKSRDDLEKKLKMSLQKDEGINIIVAPVDYSENMRLVKKLKYTFE